MRSCRARTALAGAVVAVLIAATGCTSQPAPSADPTPVASPAPTAGAPSGSASPTSAAVQTVIIGITIKDGQVTPNGTKINVTKGQTVVLQVTSDTDDEIHAHTAGDGYELEVKAGKRTDGQFVASDAGSFEVESHHLEKTIVILVVR